MAIIKSCCFWKSLRKGSFASACYTFVRVQRYFYCARRKEFLFLHEQKKTNCHRNDLVSRNDLGIEAEELNEILRHAYDLFSDIFFHIMRFDLTLPL